MGTSYVEVKPAEYPITFTVSPSHLLVPTISHHTELVGRKKHHGFGKHPMLKKRSSISHQLVNHGILWLYYMVIYHGYTMIILWIYQDI